MSDMEYTPGFGIKFSGQTTVEIAVEPSSHPETLLVYYRVELAGPEWIDYALFDRAVNQGEDYGIICYVAYPMDPEKDEMLNGRCVLIVPGHGKSNYDSPFEIAKRLAKMFGTTPEAVANATENAIQELAQFGTYEMYAGSY